MRKKVSQQLYSRIRNIILRYYYYQNFNKMKTLDLILSWTLLLIIVGVTINGKKIGNKIIGGEPVRILDYNYQVSIQINNIHICGGTIIGKSHVLTAASCVSSEISNNFHATYANMKILSGTSDLIHEHRLNSRMFNDVNYIIHHQHYNSLDFFQNDIAILRLIKPLRIDGYRGIVQVSMQHQNRSKYHIIGWGENLTGLITINLQYLNVISIITSKCRVIYPTLEIHSTQYCLIPQSSTARLSRGNGGSAVMKGRRIIGVLSVINSNPQKPALYIHTFQYYDWLANNIAAF